MTNERMYTRNMTIFDIDEIFEIEKQCFSTPWSKEAFKHEIENNELANYIVVLYDEIIVGYMGLWKILDEGHITNVAVSKNHRGLGIGKLLIEDIVKISKEEGIKEFTLEVRKENYPAISLYKKMGFEIAGIRPNYYEDTNEDAIIMWKKDRKLEEKNEGNIK